MIKVTIGNNVKREAIIIDKNTTLRAALEDNGVDYTRGVMHLDGSSLQPTVQDFYDLLNKAYNA